MGKAVKVFILGAINLEMTFQASVTNYKFGTFFVPLYAGGHMGLMLEAPHSLQMYEFFDTPIVFQKVVEQYSHLRSSSFAHGFRAPLRKLPAWRNIFCWVHHLPFWENDFLTQLWFCIWFSLFPFSWCLTSLNLFVVILAQKFKPCIASVVE